MNIKSQFPIFTNKPDLLYLDSASSTQKPEYVIQKTNEYISKSYANLGRGAYLLADESDYYYYGCKEKIAQLINCSAQELFFSYNATYCINNFAYSIAEAGYLSSGKNIILSIIEHHANILIRQKLATQFNCTIIRIGLTKNYELDIEQLKKINHSNTAVISLSLCSNVLGIKNNLNTIRSIVGDACIFCIDASQAIPNYNIDLHSIGCDFACFSAHKFLAYTGLGIGYIKKSLQKNLKAHILGGGVIEDVSQKSYNLKSSIEQFEAGTPNIISIVSLYYALERWNIYGGYENRNQNEVMLLNHLNTEFSKRSSNFKVFGESTDTIGIKTFVSLKHTNQQVNEYLSKNNICIRSGGHCAHPLHQYLNTTEGSLRLSLYVYNTIEDINHFFNTLDRI